MNIHECYFCKTNENNKLKTMLNLSNVQNVSFRYNDEEKKQEIFNEFFCHKCGASYKIMGKIIVEKILINECVIELNK